MRSFSQTAVPNRSPRQKLAFVLRTAGVEATGMPVTEFITRAVGFEAFRPGELRSVASASASRSRSIALRSVASSSVASSSLASPVQLCLSRSLSLRHVRELPRSPQRHVQRLKSLAEVCAASQPRAVIGSALQRLRSTARDNKFERLSRRFSSVTESCVIPIRASPQSASVAFVASRSTVQSQELPRVVEQSRVASCRVELRSAFSPEFDRAFAASPRPDGCPKFRLQ